MQKWHRLMIALLALLVATAAVLLSLPDPAGAHELPGRWVDFGKWNGVVACEASPTRWFPHQVEKRNSAEYRAEVRVDSVNRWSGASGAFQFLPSTWDAVAARRGARSLIGRDPRSLTLARQMKQAQWLRKHVGKSQWVCGWRYGDGTGPRYVTGEAKLPSRPWRCARRLDHRHGLKRSVARSICDR